MINIEEEKIEDLLNLNKSNREQRLAIFLDRHSFISANAGSGKTSVLIKKYIYELMKNPIIDNNPENIVAITFTKKAASEMLKRVYEGFESILKENKFADWGISRFEFEKIYRNLSKARISTIHSFCGDIIRQYPLEAGLIPGFREINQNDMKEDIEDIISKYLKEVFRNEYNKYDAENELIERLELNYFKTLLENILKKHNRFDKMQDIIENKDYIQKIKDLYKGFLFHQLKSYFEEIEKMMMYIENNAEDIHNDYYDKKSIFNDALFKIKENMSSNELLNIEFESIKNVKVKGKQYLIFLDEQSSKYGYVSQFNNHTKFRTSIVSDIKEFYKSDGKDLIQQVNDIKLFIKISKDIDKLIEDYKTEQNLVDFDNILYLANKLLDNEKICKEVKAGIKLLMVDEFQDTSDVQYDIVRKIVGDGQLDEIKLLIVGDEKQSIYAFRDAEIGVFKQSKEFVEDLNTNLITFAQINSEFRQGNVVAKGDEQFGVISLLTTYRLLPHLVAFINETSKVSFDYLNNYKYNYFKNHITDNVTQYNEFVYGIRNEKKSDNSDELISIKPDNPKIIEMINSNPIECLYYIKRYEEGIDDIDFNSNSNNEDEDTDYEESKNIEEVKMVAIRINELIKEGYKAGDFGVLSYKSADFNNLAQELNKYNIPNVVHGYNRYYVSREVRDVYCYLRFLIDPYYDVNLAALLKSYFFAFSDSEILELTIKDSLKSNEKLSLFEKLEISVDNSGNEKHKKALKSLKDSLSNYIIYDINGLINYLRINSFWYKSLEVLNITDDVNENIDSLVSSLELYQETKSMNFSDLVDFLQVKINDEKDKSEKNEVLIQEDKVNILSIHSSKGLEFNVVIMLNMYNQFNITFQVNEYSSNYSFVFKTNFEKRRNIKTPLSEVFTIEKNIIEYAEKIRLLYVGMTRARNKLILSNQVKQLKDGNLSSCHNSFSKFLMEFLNDKIQYSNYENKFNEIEFTSKVTAQDLGVQTEEFDVKYKVLKKYYYKEDIECKSEVILRNLDEVEKISLDKKIPILIKKEDFTATKFKNIHAYPMEYFKKYILRVPEEFIEKEFDFTDFEGNKVINSATKGNIIHYLMENMTLWLNEHLEVDTEQLTELIKQANSLYANEIDIDDYLYSICNKFALSKYMKTYQSDIHNFINELGIKMPLGNSFLSCKIDLCFMNGDTLEIWDWKTDKITNPKEKSEKDSVYIHQLQTYVFAAYYYFKKPLKIKAKLIYLNLLKENDTSDDWISEFDFTESDIPEIQEELKKSLIKTNKMNYGIV